MQQTLCSSDTMRIAQSSPSCSKHCPDKSRKYSGTMLSSSVTNKLLLCLALLGCAHLITVPVTVAAAATTTTGNSMPPAANSRVQQSCAAGGGNMRQLVKRGSSESTARTANRAVSGRRCTTDAQCVGYREGTDIGSPSAAKQGDQRRKPRLGEYACISGVCRYVVKAARITFNDVGEICSTAHDCAAFQIRRRWLLSSAGNNSTQTGSRLSQRDTDGENSDDGDDPSDPWCAPQYCTLESTCGGAWTLYGAPLDTPLGATASNPNANGTAISCCRGFIDNAQCGLASGSVDTCGSGHTCSTSNPRGGSNSATHARTSAHDTRDLVASLRQSARGGLDTMDEMPLGTCVSQEPHQQVWIGIVLVLIGGATLNIGLNLQKYAFRKREERANADSLAAAQDHSPRLSMPPSSDVKVKFYSSGAIDPRYQTSNSQGFAGSDPSVDKPKARNTMSTPASVAFPASHSVNKRRILGGYSGKSNASTKNYRQIIDDVPDFDDLAPAKSGETKKEGELSSTILASQRTDRLAAPVMDAEIFEMPHTRLGTPSPKDSQENILQMHTSYGSQTRLQPQQNNRHINDRSTQASAIASRPKQWYQSIHTKIASKHGSKSPFSSPMWVVGLLIFILGNVINFIALQFAPQSLVAPLGAVALVTNVIVAPLLNNEKLSLFDIGGIILIIAGCVIVVVFSGIVQQNYRLCVLIQLLKAKPTVIYLCLIAAAILCIYVFLRTVEKGVEKHQMEPSRHSAIASPGDLAEPTDNGAASKEGISDGSFSEQQQEGVKSTEAAGNANADNQLTAVPKHLSGYPSRSELPISEELWTTLRDVDDHQFKPHPSYVFETTPSENRKDSTNTCQLKEQHQHQQQNDKHSKSQGKAGAAAAAAIDQGDGYRNIDNSGMKRQSRIWWRLALEYRKTGTAIFRHPLSPFDKYIPPVSPESRYVRYGLPLAYASLGSLMATLTTLFAKSLVNLLSVSLFDRDNQFTNFISWVILLVAAFTAVSQVYWINQGLLRYDALLQVPVFYVVWTVFDIVGGGVYFNEFMLFTTVKYVVFAVGVAVIFSGVGLLSHRLKNSK